MALPSGGGEQNFIATVAVVVDEATLGQAGAQIKAALDKAVTGVDLGSLQKITDSSAKIQAALAKAAAESEKLNQALLKTALAEEKVETAKRKTEEAAVKTQIAQERLNRLVEDESKSRKVNQDLLRLEGEEYKILQAGARQLAQLEQVSAKTSAEKLQTELALNAAQAQAKTLLSEQTEQLKQQVAATSLIAQQRQAASQVNPNFSIGNLLGTIGGNFQANVLSGQGIGGAASSALTQLQQSLYQVSLGGEKATAAFANLGIEGVGAVSGLTTGLAGLGAGLLALVPLAIDFGKAIAGAYESQKELVFQSGLLSKQLGLSADQGAKIRSLLTLVGQEDNVFATITLSQIQASIAGLDRVEKGLEKASPQVEKFGKSLSELGVSYKNQNGSLKDFTSIVVELSAALEKLPGAERSLAIQNLAGLFGSDVAKIFGFGPEILTKTLQSAVAVSAEVQLANDKQRESLVELTNAQLEFNLALTSGLTPLETWTNQFKAGALREGADILGEIFSRITGINAAALEGKAGYIGSSLTRELADSFGTLYGFTPVGGLLNAIFPSPEQLRARANELKSVLAGGLDLGLFGGGVEGGLAAAAELARIQERLRELLGGGAGLGSKFSALIPAPKEISTSVEGLKALDKALGEVEKAEKDVAKAQADIVKNNLDLAKSFDAQINALQKTASGYDSYYEKVGETLGKINAIQAKEGKPFSFLGTGTVKDVEKALVDLRVLEERLGKMGEKGAGVGDPKYDQLLLNVTRRRTALGLQPGELTEAANVDITVGITGLSRKQREELNALFQQLLEFKREFLQGGFDVAQSTFSQFINGLSDSLSGNDFKTLLAGGATTLQAYAESLGLFSSPGFAQAIGEAALKADLLAGAFGDLNTAAGANAAFANYTKALGSLREDLFALSDYISGGKQLTIPIAIEFGLITQGTADLAAIDPAALKSNADRLLKAGEITVEQYRQRITEAAQARGDISDLGGGQGIVELLLGKYGLSTDEAIEATAKFAIDGEFDVTLAQKEADAQAELLRKQENSRTIAVKWKINIDPILNTEQLRDAIQAQIDALINGVLPKTGIGGTPTPIPVDQNDPDTRRAAGGHVMSHIPFFANEEGKGELYVSGRDGYILPGNDTANLLRGMGSRERLPQGNIHYAPVTNQTLNVDARGTNARDVTQAIQRTQAKQSLFTSSKPFLRDRDFLRAHGLR